MLFLSISYSFFLFLSSSLHPPPPFSSPSPAQPSPWQLTAPRCWSGTPRHSLPGTVAHHFYIILISYHFPYNFTGFLLVVFYLPLPKRSFRIQTFLHSLPPSSDIENPVEEALMKRSIKEKENRSLQQIYLCSFEANTFLVYLIFFEDNVLISL